MFSRSFWPFEKEAKCCSQNLILVALLDFKLVNWSTWIVSEHWVAPKVTYRVYWQVLLYVASIWFDVRGIRCAQGCMDTLHCNTCGQFVVQDERFGWIWSHMITIGEGSSSCKKMVSGTCTFWYCTMFYTAFGRDVLRMRVYLGPS